MTNVIGLQSNPSKCHKKSRKKPYSRGLLVLLRGGGMCSITLHSDWMPCIMRRTSGLPNTSGCPIALSTLALMLLMIWYESGGCLAHCCSTITSSGANIERGFIYKIKSYLIETLPLFGYFENSHEFLKFYHINFLTTIGAIQLFNIFLYIEEKNI